MTAPELADVWVPVSIRWWHVRAGDVIVGHDGRLWNVKHTATMTIAPWIECGTEHWHGAVDLEDAVTVLMPATEHDAMTLMRDQLGARLIERRTA